MNLLLNASRSAGPERYCAPDLRVADNERPKWSQDPAIETLQLADVGAFGSKAPTLYFVTSAMKLRRVLA